MKQNKKIEPIVERTLFLKNTVSGETKKLSIRIGTPYWSIEGEIALCPVKILGLGGRVRDIVGIDPMQALVFALRFVESQLRELPQSMLLLWPSGEKFEL